MAMSMTVTLGKKASTKKSTPITTPTLRAPMPVIRHDSGSDQHDHGAGYNGSEYPAQQGESCGKQELEEGRDDSQAGHCGGASLNQGRDADRDEGPR